MPTEPLNIGSARSQNKRSEVRNVDGTERGHRADDEERGSRRGGPYACTGRCEARQPSATRIALAAEWLAAALTSTVFCSDGIMAKDRSAARRKYQLRVASRVSSSVQPSTTMTCRATA